MPEAPEVTVAARQLGEVAVGRTLHAVEITHPRTTRAQPVEAFGRFVGCTVASVARQGKWIVMSFAPPRHASRPPTLLGNESSRPGEADVPRTLGIHLRMSGQLLVRHRDDVPEDRHVHAVFDFGGDDVVWFRDPRTFGELRVLGGGAPVAADLHDPSVTADVLHAHSRRRNVGVKAVLLDQAGAVSGVGSYLADEALHRVGIPPTRPACAVSLDEWKRLLDATRAVAEESAGAGGVTLADEGWVDLHGRQGRYASELRVHARETCASCGGPTSSAVVGGRSARWCPACQP